MHTRTLDTDGRLRIMFGRICSKTRCDIVKPDGAHHHIGEIDGSDESVGSQFALKIKGMIPKTALHDHFVENGCYFASGDVECHKAPTVVFVGFYQVLWQTGTH